MSCLPHGDKHSRCMGGHSAHPSNWYCELCETSNETLLNWFGELHDGEINPHEQHGALKFTANETEIEILRRMEQ